MVKLLMWILILLLGLPTWLLGDEPPPELIAAISRWESDNNDLAVGDKHLPEKQWAYGRLQIRQICVDDVNRRYGTKYQAKDCLGNPKLSYWICRVYIDMWATEKRLGRKSTNKDMARIWNGGPQGWKKKATEQYWLNVRQYL